MSSRERPADGGGRQTKKREKKEKEKGKAKKKNSLSVLVKRHDLLHFPCFGLFCKGCKIEQIKYALEV